MGKLVFAGIAPHPPIIIDEIGGSQNKPSEKTITAMKKWALEIKEVNPDVLIFITPHGNIFQDAVAIQDGTRLKGDFARFGVPSLSFEVENNKVLKDLIKDEIEAAGYSVVGVNDESVNRYGLRKNLDHGVLVPLYFINKAGFDVPIVVVSMAFMEYEELYKIGVAIEEAVSNSGLNVALIASSDLSHRLTQDAPAGYDPLGKEFDEKMVDIISKGKLTELLDLDEELIDRAGECGLRPCIMLAGALDKYKIIPNVLSYEGPFGVGYMVASLKVEKHDETAFQKYLIEQKKDHLFKKENESIPVKLARQSLEYYLEKGKFLPVPSPLPDMLKEKKACFVTLKKNGHLRGCIGTIEPYRKMLANEIIENSVSAGTKDPRFTPITRDELEELDISVDVLSKPEKVSGVDELDPKQYGIIVMSSGKSGVLLPNLEGVDTVEMQLSITLEKAGIRQDEEYEIYRFKVERFT